MYISLDDLSNLLFLKNNYDVFIDNFLQINQERHCFQRNIVFLSEHLCEESRIIHHSIPCHNSDDVIVTSYIYVIVQVNQCTLHNDNHYLNRSSEQMLHPFFVGQQGHLKFILSTHCSICRTYARIIKVRKTNLKIIFLIVF